MSRLHIPRSRLWTTISAALALLGFALLLACTRPEPPARIEPGAPRRPTVLRVGYSVANLATMVDFFRETMDFHLVREGTLDPIPAARGADSTREAHFAVLRLGREEVELREYQPPGRPIAEDSSSNDLWFQHLAIVVSDLDRAYQRIVSRNVRAVSVGGPQTLPAWNPDAGGIRAFYFEDPEAHVLEIIWYPENKGRARWQATQPLFLGIDHTAIAVSDTSESRAFYEDVLGFVKIGQSLNHGTEQAALSGVQGARVEITGLEGNGGPGIELLRYVEPGVGRPAPIDTSVNDLWHWEIEVAVVDPPSILAWAERNHALWSASGTALIRDPDGHALRLVRDAQ